MNKKYLEKDIYLQNKDRKFLIIDDLRCNNIIIYNIIIEHQKIIINLLKDTNNQPSKFRAKNWVEVNDESQGTHKESN